ncbi:MAG: hypothetical protein KBT67_03900 [bacterium]|nr:hypothetical protein [Candidatus Limimorpha caballi]
MRKDAIELVMNHLFTGGDDKKTLSTTDARLIERVETCYTTWLDKPMMSELSMRNFLMSRFGIDRQTALNVVNYTVMALGNVNSAAKTFVKKKIDYILSKAFAAAEAGDLKYSQTLTKIALAYGKAFNTSEDDIDLSEIRQNFTIDKVIISADPATLGIKIDGHERAETKRLLKKYNIPEDDVIDVEAEEVTDEGK